MVAANISGPRRVQAGAARDALLGVRFVDGTGTLVKNGGRVMKNVTGYDLARLMAGSWGTLGVLTEVALKVLPVPETEATLVLENLSVARSVAAMAAALGSPWEVSGAARLPDGRCLIRVEGFAGSVTYRAGRMRALLARFGPARNRGRCSPFGGALAVGSRGRALSGPSGRRLAIFPLTPSDAAAVAERLGDGRAARLGRRASVGASAREVGCPAAGRARPRPCDPDAGQRGNPCANPALSAQSSVIAGLSAGLGRQFDPGASSIRGYWAEGADADKFQRRAAARSRPCPRQPDPAVLRSLWLLHRDLPDLSGPGRRTRQPARAHLPDQANAGKRAAGGCADGETHRPLPVMPGLHDDLPVGRSLHAPGRSCARPHRGHLPPPADRPAAALDACAGPAAPRPLPACLARRKARPSLRPASARSAPARHDRHGSQVNSDPRAVPDQSAS